MIALLYFFEDTKGRLELLPQALIKLVISALVRVERIEDGPCTLLFSIVAIAATILRSTAYHISMAPRSRGTALLFDAFGKNFRPIPRFSD